MGAGSLRSIAAATVLVLVLLISGCELSFSIGGSDSEVRTSDGQAVAALISGELTEQSGVAPTSVTCPEEMAHEEGRHYECTVVHPTDGEETVDVTMKAPAGFSWLVR